MDALSRSGILIALSAVSWQVREWRDSVAKFHDADFLTEPTRTVWRLDVARDTVVLGSHQKAEDVNVDLAKQFNVDVVRRRSGGGAVWLPAGGVVWIDVVIPRGDRFWDDDVRTSPVWLGKVWARALQGFFAPKELRVHEGALDADALGSIACFVSEGPGEVMSGEGKVVGISQRRGRTGARFQCCAYTEPRIEVFADLLGLEPDQRDRLARAHVAVPASREAIVAAVLTELNA